MVQLLSAWEKDIAAISMRKNGKNWFFHWIQCQNMTFITRNLLLTSTSIKNQGESGVFIALVSSQIVNSKFFLGSDSARGKTPAIYVHVTHGFFSLSAYERKYVLQ
jgi:hypothetical protein